jgi:hypothetical protein
LFGSDAGELCVRLWASYLGDGFVAVEVGAAGVGPGVGSIRAAAATDGAADWCGEFGTVAVGLAGVVGLLFEVAELEAAWYSVVRLRGFAGVSSKTSWL